MVQSKEVFREGGPQAPSVDEVNDLAMKLYLFMENFAVEQEKYPSLGTVELTAKAHLVEALSDGFGDTQESINLVLLSVSILQAWWCRQEREHEHGFYPLALTHKVALLADRTPRCRNVVQASEDRCRRG